jgi:hypothetical protein
MAEPYELEAVNTTCFTPAWVGVPLIIPLDEIMLNPKGKLLAP